MESELNIVSNDEIKNLIYTIRGKIVILTRPIEYRKKKSNQILTKMKYSKYPNLVNAIKNRYKNYNNSVEKIIDMENKKEIFVIRPSKKLKIGRIERDENKLQEIKCQIKFIKSIERKTIL